MNRSQAPCSKHAVWCSCAWCLSKLEVALPQNQELQVRAHLGLKSSSAKSRPSGPPSYRGSFSQACLLLLTEIWGALDFSEDCWVWTPVIHFCTFSSFWLKYRSEVFSWKNNSMWIYSWSVALGKISVTICFPTNSAIFVSDVNETTFPTQSWLPCSSARFRHETHEFGLWYFVLNLCVIPSNKFPLYFSKGYHPQRL